MSIAGISIFVFACLFYLLAPIVQVSSSTYRLVNTGEFVLESAIYSNLIIFTFLLCYSIFYYISTFGSSFSVHQYLENGLQKRVSISFFQNAALLIVAISGLALALSQQLNPILMLFFFKFVAMLVFFGVAIYMRALEGRYSQQAILLLVFVLFCIVLMLLKNPLFERRNSLGPVYLTLMCLFLPVLLNKRVFLVFSLFFMMILFPASSMLTHQYGIFSGNDVSFADVLSQITGHYNDLHYDAWSNGSTMFELIDEQGHGLGKQLIGTLFFFVPRSLWEDKPISSGEMVGQYLMENSTLWFSNLSFSLPYEFFYDFGALGVIGGALILAVFVATIEEKAKKSTVWQIFVVYFSFYLYFLMRGPLLPAFAYLAPVLIASFMSERLFFTGKARSC